MICRSSPLFADSFQAICILFLTISMVFRAHVEHYANYDHLLEELVTFGNFG